MLDFDFLLQHEGSLVLLCAETDAARRWVMENIRLDDVLLWGDAIPVERRYIGDILDGIVADGLAVGAYH
jgi:hypothetical protein